MISQSDTRMFLPRVWFAVIASLLFLSTGVNAAIKVTSASPGLVKLQTGKLTVVTLKGAGLNTIKRGALYRDKAGKAKVRDLKVKYVGGVKSGRLSLTLSGKVASGNYYVRLSDSGGRNSLLPARVTVGALASAPKKQKKMTPVSTSKVINSRQTTAHVTPQAARLKQMRLAQKRSADIRRKAMISARSGQATGSRPDTVSSSTGRGPAPESVEEDNQTDTEKGQAIIDNTGKRPGTTGVSNNPGMRSGGSRQTMFNTGADTFNAAGKKLSESVSGPGSEASSNDALPEGFSTNPDEMRKGMKKPQDRRAGMVGETARTSGAGANLNQAASQADASQTSFLAGKSGFADGADGAVEAEPEGSEPEEEASSGDGSSDIVGNAGTAANTVIVVAKGVGAVAKAAGKVGLAADVIDLAPKLAKDAVNDTADIKTGVSLVAAVTGATIGAMVATGAETGFLMGGPTGALIGAVVGLAGAAVGSLFDTPCQDCAWEKNYAEEQRRRKTDPNYARMQDYIFNNKLIKGNIDPADYEIETETRAGSKENDRLGFVNPGGANGGVRVGVNSPRPPGQTGGNIDPLDDSGVPYADNTKPGQGLPQYSAGRPSQGPLNVNTGNTQVSQQEFRRIVWVLGKKIMIARMQDIKQKKNVPDDEVKFFTSEVNRMSQADFEATKNGNRNWATQFSNRYVERFGDRLKSVAQRR